MSLVPIGENIIIKLDRKPEEKTTEAGIIIPSQAILPPLEGTVISVGYKYDKQMEQVPIKTVVPGDRVMIGMYSGVEFMFDDCEYRYMKENEIIGRLLPDYSNTIKNDLKAIIFEMGNELGQETLDFFTTIINFEKTPYTVLDSNRDGKNL